MAEAGPRSADADAEPARRNRKARVRRRTRRVQTSLLAFVAVLTALAAGASAWWGVQTIADSRGGEALDTADRRPVTVLPVTPVVMLAQPASSGGLVAVTLLALSPSGAGGFVVLVPPSTLADVPGMGRTTLAAAWGAGGLQQLGAAIESLFQISLPRSELVDAAGWQALTAPVSPLDVDFADGVRVAGPDGVLQTIVPPGGAPVDAADVAGVLEARTPSESELARLVRHEEFWRSLLADEAAAGAKPATVPTTAPIRPGQPTPEPTVLTAAQVLPGLAAGPSQVLTINTTRSGGDADGERYEADVDQVRLLAARAMPGVVSPAGEGWKVRVVNPTGSPTVLEAAAHQLLASGASLVIASDSRDAPPAQTVVRYDTARGVEAGDAVAAALGQGVVSAADDRIEGVDVTVILGDDYAAAVEAGGAAADATTTTTVATAPTATTAGTVRAAGRRS